MASWLRRIRLRVGEGVRVMIVATYCETDQRRAELDYPGLEQAFPGMLAGEFEVDNRNGAGIEALREAIAKEAAALPQMG